MEITVCEDYYQIANSIFENKTAIIKDIVGDNFINIYHIGSTAVLGLVSKSQVDILLEV